MKKAFSLIEVFVSLAIAAGVFIGVAGAVNFHSQVLLKAVEKDRLNHLALNTLQKIEQPGSGVFPEPFKDYSWRVSAGPSQYQDLKLFTIEVSGKKRQFSFWMYKTDEN